MKYQKCKRPLRVICGRAPFYHQRAALGRELPLADKLTYLGVTVCDEMAWVQVVYDLDAPRLNSLQLLLKHCPILQLSPHQRLH